MTGASLAPVIIKASNPLALSAIPNGPSHRVSPIPPVSGLFAEAVKRARPAYGWPATTLDVQGLEDWPGQRDQSPWGTFSSGSRRRAGRRQRTSARNSPPADRPTTFAWSGRRTEFSRCTLLASLCISPSSCAPASQRCHGFAGQWPAVASINRERAANGDVIDFGSRSNRHAVRSPVASATCDRALAHGFRAKRATSLRHGLSESRRLSQSRDGAQRVIRRRRSTNARSTSAAASEIQMIPTIMASSA